MATIAFDAEPHTAGHLDSCVAGTGTRAASTETRAAGAEPRGAAAEPADEGRRHRLVFWICRYLPAEVAGTAAMILAGLGVTYWTSEPVVVAAAALGGEIVGFYVVLAVTVYGEQSAQTAHLARGRRRAVTRTLLLLIAEFGVAEVLDTLLIRPVALLLGVWLIGNPLWGLLAGKVIADIIFYSVAAGAFTVTDRAGLRGDAPLARIRARAVRRREGVAA